MAFVSTTVQPAPQPVAEKPIDNAAAASVLGVLALSFYAAQKSKKSFNKMKRRFMWTALKLRLKSMFSKKRVTDRVLIYILLGVIALVLVFYYPLAALLVALIALILLLAGVI
ncbi:MAG TPA: hypothetical protein VFR58_00215 [Flavisolibacter sp.]|nr:hypothetical protein [Flavisolibacter sp.]